MDTLAKLFGSQGRVKLLRFFLFNPGEVFSPDETAVRIKTGASEVRRELAMLFRIGLIKRKSAFRDTVRKRGKKKVTVRKKIAGWTLNESFPLLRELRNLILLMSPLSSKDVLERLRRFGQFKLVIVAGIFIRDWDSRIDLLLVGERIKRPKLEGAIKNIEAQFGRELRYAVFSPHDFKYRMNVYDKLLRDVFDYPHEVIVDHLGVTK